jgi:hypothetical protein
VQGAQTQTIEDMLVNRYKVPKKNIVSEDKCGKKKKQR